MAGGTTHLKSEADAFNLAIYIYIYTYRYVSTVTGTERFSVKRMVITSHY
jgi:hypothetical protein